MGNEPMAPLTPTPVQHPFVAFIAYALAVFSVIPIRVREAQKASKGKPTMKTEGKWWGHGLAAKKGRDGEYVMQSAHAHC